MKRVVMAVTCAMAAVTVFAQVLPQKVQEVPEHKNKELYRIQYNSNQLHQKSVDLISEINENRAADAVTERTKKALVRYANVGYETPQSDEIKAFYWKPEGSFFMGTSRQGHNNYQGVVGAWLDEDLRAWVFQGRSENYTDLLYKTYLSHRLPDNYYTDPVTGNWHDSLVMTVRGSVQTTYSYDMPFLTVENEQGKDTFVLSSSHKNAAMLEFDRNYMPPLTLAGGPCPYPGHEDGMWPMTNAMTLDCNEGNLILGTPYSVQPLQYFIGTTDVTVEEETITPDGMIVAYEKPQTMLYVKDITLQLEAYKVAANGKSQSKAPALAEGDTLWLTVESKMGAEIAKSYATKADLFPVVNQKDTIYAMLQFNFLGDSTAYGEQLSVGFSVDEPFQVKVTGMSKCQGDFSVVVANALYGTNAYVLTNTGETVQYAQVEPYVMLNGIYPTFIDGYTDVKDTLKIAKMEMADGTFMNAAIYEEYAEYYTLVPALYSYSYPIDTLVQKSNWTFEGPNWITWGFNDADWDGEEYSDIITLYFFAEELPEGQSFREGTVKVSHCGRVKSYYVYQGTKPADQEVGNMTGLQNNLEEQVRISTIENAFSLSYPAEFNKVEVYTIAGSKVSTIELPMSGSMLMDNSTLANGIYIFRFMGEAETVIRALK